MSEIKSIFVRTNNIVRNVELPDGKLSSDTLEPNVYKAITKETPFGLDISFQVMDNFTEPSKYYGSLLSYAKHIEDYRDNHQGNLGVLLYGMSGTGKSLLAKHLCNAFQAKGMPIIVIDANTVFNLEAIIQLLKTPCVFLLDEFEKMFENNAQQGYLLTILDGIYQTNHTFILTANETHSINPYMFSRPSRIRYAIEYENLDVELVEEILNDLLEDKSKVSQVLTLMLQIDNLSFDVLTQFIKEVNFYKDKSIKDLADLFNIELSEELLAEKYIPTLVDKKSGKSLPELLNELVKPIFEGTNINIDFVTTFGRRLTLSELSSNNFESNDLFILERIYERDYESTYFSPENVTKLKYTKSGVTFDCVFGRSAFSSLEYILANSLNIHPNLNWAEIKQKIVPALLKQFPEEFTCVCKTIAKTRYKYYF